MELASFISAHLEDLTDACAAAASNPQDADARRAACGGVLRGVAEALARPGAGRRTCEPAAHGAAVLPSARAVVTRHIAAQGLTPAPAELERFHAALDRCYADLLEGGATAAASRGDGEERFRDLADGLPLIVWVHDAQGRQEFVNHTFGEFFGVDRAQMRGDRWQILMHPEDADAYREEFLACTRERRPFHGEVRVRRADGEWRWIESWALPRRDADGGFLGFVGTSADVTERKQAAAALAEAKQRLEALLVATEVGVWHWDIPRNRMRGDRNMRELFGLSAEQADVPLEEYAERIHPDDRPGVMDEITQALASGELYEREYRVVLPDGSERWILARGRVERDAAGRAIAFPGVAVDITERRRVEASERAARASFEYLVQNSPFGIYVVDADFRLAYVSPGAQKAFENVRPLIGRDFTEVLHTLWPARFADPAIAHFRHTLASGEPYHASPFVEERKDIGEVQAYDWQIERVMLPDGRYGVVCHFYDLSERQHYEAALREADRRKDEFLATLAHELRNPLAPIQSGIEVLRLSGVPSAGEHVLTVMERQMAHMVRLVDELLDVSRISRGKVSLQRQRTDLLAALRSAVDTGIGALGGKRHLSVELPAEPLLVHADPVRLAQIIGNLLHNAVKYTAEGGRIGIAVAREGEQARVSIRDDGVGIAPGMLESVFELFVQDKTAAHAGGLGIGLTLVRSLVTLHGGTVEAHSAGEGRGSEFVVRLPLADAAPAEGRAEAARPAEVLRSRRVLVVDDNRDAADTLALLLQLMGAEVRTAHDGAGALTAFEQVRPELVFLDIGMPGMDGYAVARRLRARPEGAAAFLVALTGWGQAQDRERVREAGFDHHLVKPVALKTIEDLAQRALRTEG